MSTATATTTAKGKTAAATAKVVTQKSLKGGAHKSAKIDKSANIDKIAKIDKSAKIDKIVAGAGAGASETTTTKAISYGISKGGFPYRSFKLITVNGEPCADSHCAVNKSKKAQSTTSHLGPLRGAQKIFDAWCRENKHDVIGDTNFCIQETTRGKVTKIYQYVGRREKLDTPRKVIIAGMEGRPVVYAYRSRVRSLKFSSKGKGKGTDGLGTLSKDVGGVEDSEIVEDSEVAPLSVT